MHGNRRIKMKAKGDYENALIDDPTNRREQELSEDEWWFIEEMREAMKLDEELDEDEDLN
jgi:hypothetical protein